MGGSSRRCSVLNLASITQVPRTSMSRSTLKPAVGLSMLPGWKTLYVRPDSGPIISMSGAGGRSLVLRTLW